MAILMSSISRGVLKRRRSWRTLPGLVIAFAVFGLWQISLTFHVGRFHARFPLGLRRTTLQKDFQFASGTSEVEMLLEEVMDKVASDRGLPQESMILGMERLLEDLRQNLLVLVILVW